MATATRHRRAAACRCCSSTTMRRSGNACRSCSNRKGFAVTAVGSLAEARAIAGELKPGHAVVDMRLEDGNGLDLVAELRALSPDVRIVMLTGYGNLATAVAAVKAGAVDYLAKPADPEDIVRRAGRRRQQPRRKPRRNRCRPTGCAGNISSASMNCATATCRKPRGG